MKLKRVWLLSGPVACGKSSWAKAQCQKNPRAILISRDIVRRECLKDEIQFESVIFYLWINQIKEAIADDNIDEIFVDATHLTDRSRCDTVDELPIEDIQVVCVIFNSSLDYCLTRNKETANLPEDVVKSMHNKLQRYSDLYDYILLKEDDINE